MIIFIVFKSTVYTLFSLKSSFTISCIVFYAGCEFFQFIFIWNVFISLSYLKCNSTCRILNWWFFVAVFNTLNILFQCIPTLLFLMRSQQLNITFSPCMRCVIFFSFFHIHILILSPLQSHSFSSNIITGIILFSSAWGSLKFLDQ